MQWLAVSFMGCVRQWLDRVHLSWTNGTKPSWLRHNHFMFKCIGILTMLQTYMHTRGGLASATAFTLIDTDKLHETAAWISRDMYARTYKNSISEIHHYSTNHTRSNSLQTCIQCLNANCVCTKRQSRGFFQSINAPYCNSVEWHFPHFPTLQHKHSHNRRIIWNPPHLTT